MLKKFSSYLDSKHDLAKDLVEKLSKKFSYVSVLGSDCEGKQFHITETDVEIKESYWQERGFVVRVFANGLFSEYSFDDLDDVKNISEEIIKSVDISDQLYKAIYAKSRTNMAYDEDSIERLFSKMGEFTDVNQQDIIDMSKKIIADSMEDNEYIIAAYTDIEYLKVSKMFISNKKDLRQVYAWANANYSCVVNKNGITKSCYGGASSISLKSALEELNQKVKNINDEATTLLDAMQIEPGLYDCITSPEITGLIAHESFGHGLEMDMFVKNRALAKDYMGRSIGSSLVNMHDGAIPYNDVSSYYFDDEGNLAHDTKLVENGKLINGMCDAITARQLGLIPTGNGKRENYRHKAYTRMTSTYFMPGKSSLEDMIKSIDYGYLIDIEYSGMEDPKNWQIQCVALVGKEIKDGQLTGKVVSPLIITGYLPDVLSTVSMISKDFKLYGTGSCGKGYKEYTKVALGGPYMKVKVKLG